MTEQDLQAARDFLVTHRNAIVNVYADGTRVMQHNPAAPHIEALLAEVGRLRALLKPFAGLANFCTAHLPERHPLSVNVSTIAAVTGPATVGDCRAAREALEGK